MKNVFIVLIVLFVFLLLFDYEPLQIVFEDIYAFISQYGLSIIIGFVLFAFLFFWIAKR
ncbi:hypothetical protein [Filobacillus milosensis]|uniref:hypothetical protein n=1 Tax=Filobacillus milosensis TaxID=94137 RepID=UPI00129B586F|nr:hypothetical protein [Filobacillus milosensis]